MQLKGHLISQVNQKLVKSLKMKMKFWACVIIKTQLSYKGKKEKENLVKEINAYYPTSHIGRTCQKSSKICQCWFWTGLTDSALI